MPSSATTYKIGRVIVVSNDDRYDPRPYLVEWNPDGSQDIAWCPESELKAVNGLSLFLWLI